ncbi:MAG TPA: hypothetical protein VGG99_21830 [Acetobacteraceae bacterium]|jgi:hypothetical protein
MSLHRTTEPNARSALTGLNAGISKHASPPARADAATNAHCLSTQARNLFERLSLLAPDPVPDFVLLVPVPFAPDEDAHAGLDELIAHTLVTRDANSGTFRVRRPVYVAATEQRLFETLYWMIAAFAGDPMDKRCWPWLGRLVPHAEAVAARADKAGITEPTAQLVHLIAVLLHARSSTSVMMTH